MADHPLTLLLAFDDQVRRDQRQSPVFLHRRDRKFALDAGAAGCDTTPRQWLDYLHRFSGPRQPTPDKRLLRWRRITLGFAVTGALLGILTMLGLLFYDGSGRINVTVILAVVLLQLLLALATTVQAFAGWRPWGWLVDRYTRSSGELASVLSRLHPQLLAKAAHTGGLAFGITGLLTLLALVVVQDLAFGWSTTLDTATDGYLALVHAIAWPWHQLWPAAVPDAALVEGTRFFRAGPPQAVNAGRWGDWWPFVAMVWGWYVILPRLLLRLLAGQHQRLRARRLLIGHPGLTALHYRMETPTLETGDGGAETSPLPDLSTDARLRPYPDSPLVIQWAGAGDPALPADFAANTRRQLLRAGGAASLDDDRATLKAARACLAGGDTPSAIVLTRAWEPPTGELEDFLAEARRLWPSNTLIALVPLATAPGQPPEQTQLAQWLRFAERLGDERLQVSIYDSAPAGVPWPAGASS